MWIGKLRMHIVANLVTYIIIDVLTELYYTVKNIQLSSQFISNALLESINLIKLNMLTSCWCINMPV